MALYSNLYDYRFNDTDIDDIRGASVYGVDDEKLGTIDDVIYDSQNGQLRYVVINSGGWLSTKRFIVPALRVMIREEGDKDFYINLTKKQVERLPEFKEKEIESETHWADYEHRYEAAWEEEPVLHKKDSTHAVTPERVEGANIDGDVHVQTPRRIAHDMPKFGASSATDTNDSVSLIGETEAEPVVSGARKEIARQVDEPISDPNEIKEDRIGTGSIDRLSHNARLRAFEERLRRDREEIARHRGKRAA